MPSRILRPCIRSILRTFSDRFSEHQSICKEGIPWLISGAEDFPTDILLISDEVFTENGLSTELGTSWRPGEFGEHVPDVHQHRRTPTCNPRRPTVFCRRSMKDFRGGPASSSTIFANTKMGDLRGLFRGNVAMEIGHGIPSCKHPTKLTEAGRPGSSEVTM